MNPIQALLMQGGVSDIKAHGEGLLSGQLPVPTVGLARCIARVTDDKFVLQVQLMPASVADGGAEAVAKYLEVLSGQVKLAGFGTGQDVAKGVVWLGLEGLCAQAAVGVRSVLALAGPALKAVNALAADAHLARTYLAMQAPADSGH